MQGTRRGAPSDVRDAREETRVYVNAHLVLVDDNDNDQGHRYYSIPHHKKESLEPQRNSDNEDHTRGKQSCPHEA